MLVRDYIQDRYQSMGFAVGEASLLDICLSVPISADEEVGGDNIDLLQRAIILSLPSLLLRPESISELGVSISTAKREDIIRYYLGECKRLGLKVDESLKPKKNRIRIL